MKLLYFAWIREKIGVSHEFRELPEGVFTVADLMEWLKSVGNGYTEAFEERSVIRVAINQEYAQLDDKVTTNDEVAFFPPVTGG